MQNTNDLRGLESVGFKNCTDKFNEETFKENITINLVRNAIRKYFTKSKNINKDLSSYGLKHTLERHLGTYVSNGELIYAMHLEGFKIERDRINCFFNLKLSGLSELSNSNEILKYLKIATDCDIEVHLISSQKKYAKYKYPFNFLINNRISKQLRVGRYIIPIIAKEMSEDVKTIRSWFNILKDNKVVIPAKKMQQLKDIFNLDIEKSINK